MWRWSKRLMRAAGWVLLIAASISWWLSYRREDTWQVDYWASGRYWRVRVETGGGGLGLHCERGYYSGDRHGRRFEHETYHPRLITFPLVEGRGWWTWLGVSFDFLSHGGGGGGGGGGAVRMSVPLWLPVVGLTLENLGALRRHLRRRRRAHRLAAGECVACGYDLVVVVRGHEPLPLAEYQRLLSGAAVKLHNAHQRRQRAAATAGGERPDTSGGGGGGGGGAESTGAGQPGTRA